MFEGIKISSRFARVAALFATLTAGAICTAADNLRINVDSAISTLGGLSYTPVWITVENKGPSTRGVINLHGAYTSFKLDIPIELPQGARKRIPTIVQIDQGDALVAELNTDKGSTKTQLNLPSSSGTNYALIAQERRGLQPLRTDHSYDGYILPEEAPVSALGYGRISAVFLGAGAERMTDEAVKALQAYVVSGGNLVFVGGASGAAMRDPRWQGYLPTQPPTLVTKRLSEKARKEFGLADVDWSLQAGALTPGATSALEDDGTTIVAGKRVGYGRAISLAFDYLNGSATNKSDIQYLIGNGYPGALIIPGSANLRFTSQGESQYDPGSQRYSSGFGSLKIELPPVTSLLAMLAGYIVLVVFINMGLLRKKNKSELAWFTAPVISLGFAAFLFAIPSRLYTLSSFVNTNAVVLLDENIPSGIASSSNSLFFRTSGVYDLQLDSLINIIDGGNDGLDYGYREDNTFQNRLNLHDVGGYRADSFEAGNIALQKLDVAQVIQNPVKVESKLFWTFKQGRRMIEGTITNRSSFTLRGARLTCYQSASLGQDIAPQETKRFSLDLASIEKALAAPMGSDRKPISDIVKRFRARPKVVLEASCNEIAVGPRVATRDSGSVTTLEIAVHPMEGQP